MITLRHLAIKYFNRLGINFHPYLFILMEARVSNVTSREGEYVNRSTRKGLYLGWQVNRGESVTAQGFIPGGAAFHRILSPSRSQVRALNTTQTILDSNPILEHERASSGLRWPLAQREANRKNPPGTTSRVRGLPNTQAKPPRRGLLAYRPGVSEGLAQFHLLPHVSATCPGET